MAMRQVFLVPVEDNDETIAITAMVTPDTVPLPGIYA